MVTAVLSSMGESVAMDELHALIPKIHGWICQKYPGLDNAEDLAQDAAIKAITYFHQYTGKGSLENWVKSIAFNEVRGYFRARGTIKAGHEFPHENSVEDYECRGLNQEDQIAFEALAPLILQALNSLPDIYRRTWLHRFKGRSSKEIAIIEGSNEGTIDRRLKEANQRLQKQLTYKGDGSE